MFCLAQQDETAVRRDQAAIEGGAHPLALDAWQIEGQRRLSSLTAGVASFGKEGRLYAIVTIAPPLRNWPARSGRSNSLRTQTLSGGVETIVYNPLCQRVKSV